MKKRALITAILISVASLVLVGYFAGCSSKKTEAPPLQAEGRPAPQPVDKTAEAALVEEREKTIAGPQIPGKAASTPALAEGMDRFEFGEQLEGLGLKEAGKDGDRIRLYYNRRAEVSNVNGVARKRLEAYADRKSVQFNDARRGGYAGRVPTLGDEPILGRLFSTTKADKLGKLGAAGTHQAGRPIPAELLNVSEDEIWVIARPQTQAAPADEDTPGCGAMLAKLPKQDKEIPLPLKHTDVTGQITGYIATVDVTQQFHNPYDEKIEAVYVFPLPQNAAINEFIMTIGDRRIRGIIQARTNHE